MDPPLAVESGTHFQNKSAAHPRRASFSVLVNLILNCTGHLHFLRTVVERLGQCHRDADPLVHCPSTESSLPATPRCAAASAFVLHGTTTRVSTRLTVHVDRKPKLLRTWWWCGGEEVVVEGGEEASDLRRPLRAPFWRPFRSPPGARPVTFWGFYRSVRGPFLAQSCGKGRAPHHDHGRGWGRLTTCESRH